MPKITEREFKASYDLAKKVYGNKLQAEEAIKKLVDEYQMNKESAKISIDFFQEFMEGNLYKRTLSQRHARYYFDGVLRDYNKEKLKMFLQALEKHIEYRENLKQKGFRKLHCEFSNKIDLASIF